MPSKHSVLKRTIAGGAAAAGAVACFGLFSPATAGADNVNGNGNSVQSNTLANNNVGFQTGLGFGGSSRNRSRNTTTGNVSALNGNVNILQANVQGPPQQSLLPSNNINGNGNSVQSNVGSNNNIGAQTAFGSSNRSRNRTTGNVAIGNGNFNIFQANIQNPPPPPPPPTDGQ